MTDSDAAHGKPAARDRDNARRKSFELSRVKENRNAAIYQQMETDRVASDAKTAKLRALRLAKEESEREAARIALEDGAATSAKSGPDTP